MWYKIEPLDTLFFRDGRPFSMGAETWANSIFPPYPSTVYGAIRTWLIFEKGGLKEFKESKYKEELGTPTEKGSLRIKGPFISLDEKLYFPVPNDFLKKKHGDKSEKNNLFYLDWIKKPKLFISEYPLEYVLINKKDFLLDQSDGFINIDSFKDYLLNNEKYLQFREKTEICMVEKKTGIKRSRETLSAEEEHLYRIPMIRLEKEASFFVDINGLSSYPQSGIVQLGADWKMVKIEKIEKDFGDELKKLDFQLNNRVFKIYFATPAIFKKGWLPEWIGENLEGKYNGIPLKLISCSLGKSILIGGWDLTYKKPKKMYRGVSAGSVYYFQVLDETPVEKIKESFHLKNISDINPEEGFGLSLIGEVKQ